MKKSIIVVFMGLFLLSGLGRAENSSKELVFTDSEGRQNIRVPVWMDGKDRYVSLSHFTRQARLLYDFNFITRKAMIRNDSKTVQVMPDASWISCNMDVYYSERAPKMHEGSIYLPVSMMPVVLEQLGLDHYDWDRDPEKEAETLPEKDILPVIAVPIASVQDIEIPAVNTSAVRDTVNAVAKAVDKAVTPEGRNTLKFVVIDAGHGGKDPGGIGQTGLREKTVVLDVIQRVRTILKAELPQVTVFMTRDDNTFVTLNGRSKKANWILKKYRNGMFVSVHANIARNKNTYGYETYYLSDNPSDDHARAVAAMENGVIEADGKSLDTVKMLLSSMLDAELIRQSRLLAEAVTAGYDKNLKGYTKSRGIKTARFYVLEGTMMPSILTEVGFLSNKNEEKLLRSSTYLQKVARSIADGIINFAKHYNKHNGFS